MRYQPYQWPMQPFSAHQGNQQNQQPTATPVRQGTDEAIPYSRRWAREQSQRNVQLNVDVSGLSPYGPEMRVPLEQRRPRGRRYVMPRDVPYTPPVEQQRPREQHYAGFWDGAWHNTETGEVTPVGEGLRLLNQRIPYEYRENFYRVYLAYSNMPASYAERSQRRATLGIAETIGRLIPRLIEGHTEREGTALLADFNDLSDRIMPRLRSNHQQAFIDAIHNCRGLNLTYTGSRWVFGESPRASGSSGRSNPNYTSYTGAGSTNRRTGSSGRMGNRPSSGASGTRGQEGANKSSDAGRKTDADRNSEMARLKKRGEELSTLEGEVKTLESQGEKRIQEIADLDKNLSESIANRDRILESLGKFRTESAASLVRSAEADQALEKIQKNIAQLRIQHDQAIDTNRLDDAKKAIAQIEELRPSIVAAKAQIATVRTEVLTARQQLNDAEKQYNEAVRLSLERTELLTKLRNQQAEDGKTITSMRKRVTQMRTELSSR